MYKFSYDEILADDCREGRTRERIAFDRAIELMERADRQGSRSPEALEAISYVQKLWGFLIKDLSGPGNGLPEALKSDLMGIGFWSMREADRILNDRADSFAGLIAVNSSIRDGLR